MAAPKKVGRTSKFTPETVQKIKQAIELGATYELAAAYGGIAASTFYEWMNAKPEFSESIKSSEGLAAVKWLAKIEQAATDGNWQAAAWKLERRYPDSYGRQRIEHSGTIALSWDNVMKSSEDDKASDSEDPFA